MPQPDRLPVIDGWSSYSWAAVYVYALSGTYHRDFGKLETMETVVQRLSEAEHTLSGKSEAEKTTIEAAKMVLSHRDRSDFVVDFYRNLKVAEAMIDQLQSGSDIEKDAASAVDGTQSVAAYAKFFEGLPNMMDCDAFKVMLQKAQHLRNHGSKERMLMVWGMAGAYHRDFGQLRHWGVVLGCLKDLELDEHDNKYIRGFAKAITAKKAPRADEIFLRDTQAKFNVWYMDANKLEKKANTAFSHRQKRKFYVSLFVDLPQIDNVSALVDYLAESDRPERAESLVVLVGAFHRDHGRPVVWQQMLAALESVGSKFTSKLISEYTEQFATVPGVLKHLQFKDKFIRSVGADTKDLLKLTNSVKKHRQPASFYEKIFADRPTPDIPKLIDFLEGPNSGSNGRIVVTNALSLALAYIRDAGRPEEWKFVVWELKKIVTSSPYSAEHAYYQLNEIVHVV